MFLVCLPYSTECVEGEHRRNIMSFSGLFRIARIFADRAVKLTLELTGVDEICPFVANDGNIGYSALEFTLKRCLS